MPQMSGFEFLSVARRRFPEILVIAMSGAYQEGSAVPGGVIAYGFYPKGSHPEALFSTVADLIKTAATRQAAHRKDPRRCGFHEMARTQRECPTSC